MAIAKRSNSVIRLVNDFDLIRREKTWSGRVSDTIRTKFNLLKMEYNRFISDQHKSFSEDGYNTLKIKG